MDFTCLFSAYTFLKFMVMWTLVLLADFILEFRLEYLWPCWLFFGSVYTTFHCHGLVRTPAVCSHVLYCSPNNEWSYNKTPWLFFCIKKNNKKFFFCSELNSPCLFSGYLCCFCLCRLHTGHLLFNFCSFALAVFCGEHLRFIQLYMAHRWVCSISLPTEVTHTYIYIQYILIYVDR